MLQSETEPRANWQVEIIAKALNAVRRAVGFVEKDGHNDFSNYDYVSEMGTVIKLRPHFIEHGLILTPSVSRDHPIQVHTGLGNKGNTFSIVWVQSFHLAHESGAVWPFPIEVVCQGADSGDKAPWQGNTNAHKYALLRLLMLPTGDDPEANEETDRNFSGGAAPKPQREAGVGTPGSDSKPRSEETPLPDEPEERAAERPVSGVAGANYDGCQELLDHVGPGHIMTAILLKEHGFYRDGFKAAEAVFGKLDRDDKRKFECIDAFSALQDLDRDNKMTAYHLPLWREHLVEWTAQMKGRQPVDKERKPRPTTEQNDDIPFN